MSISQEARITDLEMALQKAIELGDGLMKQRAECGEEMPWDGRLGSEPSNEWKRLRPTLVRVLNRKV